MRNILALAALAFLLLAGTGYLLGWYTVDTKLGQDGKRNINIDINTNKISKDVDHGRDFIQDKIKSAEEVVKKAEKEVANHTGGKK
ncbi:MAG: hypothetical protein EXR99_04285 [Gemmataceae bacterium]|nr:hypothetical protein [Gemmataceae bacterium]